MLVLDNFLESSNRTLVHFDVMFTTYVQFLSKLILQLHLQQSYVSP
jgi:hypothetical protein